MTRFGIQNIALYLPSTGVSRALLRAVSSGKLPDAADESSVRRVANFDEDALTLAWEALTRKVTGNTMVRWNDLSIGGGYARIAPLLARTFQAPRHIEEVGGGPRGGWDGLAASLATGAISPLCLLGTSVTHADGDNSVMTTWSDAGASVEFSHDAPVEIVATHNIEFPYLDLERPDATRLHLQPLSGYAVQTYITEIKTVVESFGLQLDATMIALSTPHAGLIKKVKRLQAGAVSASDLLERGYCGAADPMFVLADALQNADGPDDIVLLIQGAGLTALQLRRHQGRPDISPPRWTEPQHRIGTEQWRAFRRLTLDVPAGPTTSDVLDAGDQDWMWDLQGGRCGDCNALTFPTQSRCHVCGSEQLTPDAISSSGTAFTFTVDHLHGSPKPPTTMVVAEMDGGGRVYLQGCDDMAHKVDIDIPVEMVMRRIHDGEDGRTPHYFWKLRSRSSK